MVRVSRALLDSLRGADLIGRQNKDELITFLPKASGFSWETISKRIHTNIGAQSGRVEKPYGVSVGTGHCEFDPESPVAFEVLMEKACEELENDCGRGRV
jgi:GGDEF domain-containing protein